MEGGLSASFEKFVIDCEMLQQIIYAQRPITVDAATLALDAIAEVGPHGHFLDVRTHKSAIVTRFIRRYCRIGAIMKHGLMMAACGRISGRKHIIKRYLMNMWPRQWIARIATSLPILSRAERLKVARQRIFNKGAGSVGSKKRAFI